MSVLDRPKVHVQLEHNVNMEKLIVYLAGAINGCTDEQAKDWREYVKTAYPQYSYLDPMRNDYRGRENEPGIDAEIVEGDKADIAESDIMLVNYDKPSVGTSMEVFYATSIGRPVIVVARPDTVISPWLKYHSTVIVPSFAEAFAKIAEIEKEYRESFDVFEDEVSGIVANVSELFSTVLK